MGGTRRGTRLTQREAAERLGVSVEAIRKRVKRGTLRSDKGEDGRRYVYLDDAPDAGGDEAEGQRAGERRSEATEDRTDELIATLREQLAEEREARRRADTIIAQLARTTEEQARTIRELEPAQEPDDSSEAPQDEQPDARQSPKWGEAEGERGAAPADPQAATSRRPWWRRVFGG